MKRDDERSSPARSRALLTATAASAEITVGVSDDLPIAAPGVAADFYAAMQTSACARTGSRSSGTRRRRRRSPSEAGLDRALAEAGARGVSVVLSLYPLRPRAI